MFQPGRSASRSIPTRSAVNETPRAVSAVILLLVVSVWIVTIILLLPSWGDFPLNDDWSYGITVRRLLETGQFHPPEQVFAPFITNAMWGVLFCYPLGFSFTALRLSTLVASVVGISGTYLLIRTIARPAWIAALVSLTVAFNPIFYALSQTFMTDASFFAMATWTLVFFTRSLLRDSAADAAWGTLVALVATLSRQLAVSIPIAFGVALLLRPKGSRGSVFRAVIPTAVCIVGFLTFRHWMSQGIQSAPLLDARTAELFDSLRHLDSLLVSFLGNVFALSLYLGLFLLPVSLLRLRHPMQQVKREAFWSIGVALLLLSVGAFVRVTHPKTFGDSLTFPLQIPGNIIVRSGIGPLTLRDTFLLKLDHVSELPHLVWLVVTGAGLVGAALLISPLAAHLRGTDFKRLARKSAPNIHSVGTFLVLAGVIYLCPLLIADARPYDRYLIPVILPFAGALLIIMEPSGATPTGNTRAVRVCSAVAVLMFAVYAVAGTRDYLTWNSLRWQALKYLDSEGVYPEDIDGGYEFNGLYLYDPRYLGDGCRSYWWVQRDNYEIAFGSVPGFEVAKGYEYRPWLVSGQQNVLLLKKQQTTDSYTAGLYQSQCRAY